MLCFIVLCDFRSGWQPVSLNAEKRRFGWILMKLMKLLMPTHVSVYFCFWALFNPSQESPYEKKIQCLSSGGQCRVVMIDKNLTLFPTFRLDLFLRWWAQKKSRAGYHDNWYALFVVNSGVLLAVLLTTWPGWILSCFEIGQSFYH